MLVFVKIKTRLDCKIGGLVKIASEKVQTNSRANFTREIVWTLSLAQEARALRREPPRAPDPPPEKGLRHDLERLG
jgi:hypothetical protein